MQPNDSVGTARSCRHLDDRERRRVRGEDRVLGADLVQFLEHAILDLDILDDRLDDEIAVAKIIELSRAGHPIERCLAILGRDLLLIHRLL